MLYYVCMSRGFEIELMTKWKRESKIIFSYAENQSIEAIAKLNAKVKSTYMYECN